MFLHLGFVEGFGLMCVLQIPALLMLMMCICMWLNFQDFWPDALPPVYYPILFLCLAGFVILNPFPILYHRSRKWFANAHVSLSVVDIILRIVTNIFV